MDCMNKNDFNAYIDSLINPTFSIFPIYEESGYTDNLANKIFNLSVKLDGFFHFFAFDKIIMLDILSLVNELQNTKEYKKVRSCVLKICSLLGQMKVVDAE